MLPSIIQFGTSRFLQAHADLFVHQAREADPEVGTIAVVAGSGSTANLGRLAAFNDPAGFPVVIRGLEAGQPVEEHVQVRSVLRGLDAARDWDELRTLFVEDAEFVISNTTEAGLGASAAYPARLLALLEARFTAGRPGLVILPTELVGRNGEVLRDTVLALAQDKDERLQAWIANECVFANSLVDRIVSEPLKPAGAVAEPYALWAVEAQRGLTLPCRHPAIQVVDDLEPVERLKIHILNLGHTVLAQHWMELGSPAGMTVLEMLGSAEASAMLEAIYADEVIPGFRLKGLGPDAEDYVATTLDRFRNPFLRHRLADIAANHQAKIEKRLLGFLRWAGCVRTPRLEALAARAGGASS